MSLINFNLYGAGIFMSLATLGIEIIGRLKPLIFKQFHSNWMLTYAQPINLFALLMMIGPFAPTKTDFTICMLFPIYLFTVFGCLL